MAWGLEGFCLTSSQEILCCMARARQQFLGWEEHSAQSGQDATAFLFLGEKCSVVVQDKSSC